MVAIALANPNAWINAETEFDKEATDIARQVDSTSLSAENTETAVRNCLVSGHSCMIAAKVQANGKDATR